MRSFTAIVCFFVGGLLHGLPANGQITTSRSLSADQNHLATLKEQLTNRLRATRNDQRAYLNFVIKLVDQGKLDRSLVVALERYALRRNPSYPFPFFERAMKYECGKRGVSLPAVKQFANTRPVTPG